MNDTIVTNDDILLAKLGATAAEIAELLEYCSNNLDSSNRSKLTFPLDSEPHIAAWKRYQSQGEELGIFTAIQSALVQLQFPIQAGISETEDYRAATRKGNLTEGMVAATGLKLVNPTDLQLIIHPTLAGEVPILIAGCREDFISLVRALTKRNEPVDIPDSMGATAVSGLNNWERIRHYRQEWESSQIEPDWQGEFQRIIPQKSLYQDFLIILSQGNYSAVPAAQLGLDEATWLDLSLKIRLEHECCHYFTKRVFGSMRNNMLDELIADYQGIIAVNDGRYRSDWFCHFVGLEAFPEYRVGGRLENYRGNPPLSDGAFKILQILIKQAAANLERLNIDRSEELKSLSAQANLVMDLTTSNLASLYHIGGIIH